jgi:hypothetical protein
MPFTVRRRTRAQVGVALGADRARGVAGLAASLQQRGLEIVGRGEIVADAQGAGEVRVGGEELVAAGEAEDRLQQLLALLRTNIRPSVSPTSRMSRRSNLLSGIRSSGE